jgi:membrane protease YdiL (CAAX protease family)
MRFADGVTGAGAVLPGVVIVAALAAAYGPALRYGTRYAMRLSHRGSGRPAGRQLVQAAAETTAHLAAVALIVIVLLAAGRPGRAQLADLGAAIVMGGRAPALAIAGLAVGVAEAGLAALAASAVLAGARAWRPSPAGPRRVTVSTASAWLSLSRSSWARRWPRPGDGGPAAVAGVVLLAGVAAEETVFRGLLITAMGPLGGMVAVTVAGVAYLAYGLTRSAASGSQVEAASCCLVLCVVNGTLFWLVPALLPLVAAQLAFVMFNG